MEDELAKLDRKIYEIHHSLQNFSDQSSIIIPNEFRRSQETFMSRSSSFFRNNCIRRIAKKLKLETNSTCYFNRVKLVIEILLVNEIEMIYWMLLLKTTPKSNIHINPWLLLMSALRCKLELNQNSRMYKDLLFLNLENFEINYIFWANLTNHETISSRRLNEYYKKLTEKLFIKRFGRIRQ